MTDKLLFDLPAEGPPALEIARKRLAAAQEAYDAADFVIDGLREVRPFDVTTELRNARACLALLESREIERRDK